MALPVLNWRDRQKFGDPPVFQHRHFAFIAHAISELPMGHRQTVAHHFEQALKATNPRFDGPRFRAACKGKDDV